jgi:hypothetical protein
MWTLTAVVLMTFAFTDGATNAGKPVPLSVCELIENRAQYNGRVVAVRGEVKGGAQGPWLQAAGCPYRLFTKGVEWPDKIYLTYPLNQSEIDWASVVRAGEALKHSSFNSKADSIIETYVGTFVTYDDLGSRVTPYSPGAARFGFGPLGDAPAQLLIRSVGEGVVIHGAVSR